jgi:GT2 family glycosyltransferase
MSTCAVIVTYNRRVLLVQCLAALAAQTVAPDRILVVDNASTDGTAEMVRRDYPSIDLAALPVNSGGAGGFHEGLRRAHAGGADWVWLMDDDTIAEPSAHEELLRHVDHQDPLGRPVSLLSSRAVWTDGQLHPMNAQGFERTRTGLVVEAAKQHLMPLRTATFVSLFVHRGAVDRHGLPLRRYVLWSDDIEYTARVLRHDAGFVVPASVVVHKTATAHTATTASPERFYLHVRNSIYMLRGTAWSRSEKLSLLFGLLVSVAQYVRHQRFAGAPLRAIFRGTRDGLRRGAPTPLNP